jgi:HrpA-like RNA helicase
LHLTIEKYPSIHFDSAPILFIKGRTYPVVINHAQADPGPDKVQAALRQCLKIHLDLPPGDILVFMPGESVFEDVQAAHSARADKDR